VLCASRGEADVSCREQNVKRDAEKVELALNSVNFQILLIFIFIILFLIELFIFSFFCGRPDSNL
jgi:hypothetical protein